MSDPVPQHVTAEALPPDYFAPSPRCLWAVAFYGGDSSVYPFHRDRDGSEWRAGWTEAARVAYTAAPEHVTRICSWCPGARERTIQATDRGERVTHTICPTCVAAMAAELEAITSQPPKVVTEGNSL